MGGLGGGGRREGGAKREEGKGGLRMLSECWLKGLRTAQFTQSMRRKEIIVALGVVRLLFP